MATFPHPIPLELPEPLYQALTTYQQQHAHPSLAIAILSILEDFLQPPTQAPIWVTQEQLQHLEAKVNELSQLINPRNPAIAPSPRTTQIRPLQTNLNSFRTTTSSSSSISLEEIDDEPDEILYDFLE